MARPTAVFVALLLLAGYLAPVAVHGGGSLTTSGQSSSTACTLSDGTQCARDGSSNQCTRSLTYDATTGKFSGTMITNLCASNRWGRDANGTLFTSGAGHTVSCKSQTFPAPDYATIPTGGKSAPTRGTVGYTLYGVNVYGPFEAGFSAGQACDNSLGVCAAGLDIGTCESILKYQCGESHVTYGMLMDSCGGHATPYHHHIRMKCDEERNEPLSSSTPAGHSPLVGIALDGRGIYGQNEASGVAPTNLDACGGHVGPVPTITLSGITGMSSDSVYHYHTQANPPYLLGCYGPATLAQCKTAYSSTCGTGTTSVTTASGTVEYDTDCPCYTDNSAVTTTTASGTTSTTTTTTAATTGSTASPISATTRAPVSVPSGLLTSSAQRVAAGTLLLALAVVLPVL